MEHVAVFFRRQRPGRQAQQMTDHPSEPTSRRVDCPAPARVLKVVLLLATCWAPVLAANEQVLTDRLHHLRNDETREWSSFPEQALSLIHI